MTDASTISSNTWSRWLGAAGTSLLLVLSACGGDSSSPQDGADGGSEDAPDSGDEGGDGDGATTLGDILGTGGSIDERAGQVREAETRRQELVRDCMEEQGFDFVVHVVAGQIESPMGLPTDLSDEEFRRQYGYGIATGFESALQRSPAEAAPDEAADPNVAIVDALSPSELAAYEQALRGSESADGAPGGCEGEALAATDRAGRLTTEFGDQLDDLNRRVAADTRVVEAEAEWADCMEEAGYPYPDERAVRSELLRRLNPLNEAVMGSDVPEGVVRFEPGLALSEDQQSQLAELRTFELAVANADQDCRDDLDEIRADVRAEYESEFVDANRSRLRDLFPDAGL